MAEDKNYGFADLSSDERGARKIYLIAGISYGALFGLAYAVFTWGFDAFVLWSNGAVLPWSKLVIGLPLALVLGMLAGWLAALSSTIIIPVVIWAVLCGLLAAIAAHIPFEGGNLVIWFVDSRFWNEAIFSYNSSAATRTTLMVFISVVLGTVVGYFQTIAMNWAWDRSSPGGRMTLGSWLSLLVAAPVALLPALSVNGFINQPLRYPQQVVSKSLQLALSGAQVEDLTAESQQASLRSLEHYRERLSFDYETYFVAFSSETGTWQSAYIDILFEDGFVLRCVTVGERVVYCDDFSKRLAGWVNQLVRNALYAERPWLETPIRRLDVNERVIDWLADHRVRISENYEVARESQQSGWVYMRVRFDTGFEMVCRFRGIQPTVVDQCGEAPIPNP